MCGVGLKEWIRLNGISGFGAPWVKKRGGGEMERRGGKGGEMKRRGGKGGEMKRRGGKGGEMKRRGGKGGEMKRREWKGEKKEMAREGKV